MLVSSQETEKRADRRRKNKMVKGDGSSSNEERNMKEKQRRVRMKQLCQQLSSLVSLGSSSRLSGPQLLDQTSCYAEQLKERLMTLERRKGSLLGGNTGNCADVPSSSRSPPVLSMNVWESALEVNLITRRSHQNFMLSEIISVLEEEGAQVFSVHLHNTEDRAIYVIKSQAVSPRIGMEISRIEERLKDIIL